MCRLAAWFAVALVGVSAPAAAGDSPAIAPLGHVRASDHRTKQLLQEGLARSASLRDLVQRLDATDLIVYIQQPARFESGLAGGLTFMSATSEFRYFNVLLSIEQTTGGAVAMLGHELQHALEVSTAPEVRSTPTLVAFYDRIGVKWNDHRWDTDGAQQMGRRVRSEFAHRRSEQATSRRCG